MRVSITLEHRFLRTADGRVWTQTESSYSVWEPMLSVFEDVQCVARIEDVQTVPADWQEANGPGVSFAAIPSYIGPADYFRKARRVRAAVRASIDPGDAVMLCNGNLASIAHGALARRGQPYAMKLASDPHGVFARGAIRHPLRPLVRWWSVRQLREQCAEAQLILYVTSHALQERYPTGGLSMAISDVDLPSESFALAPRVFDTTPRPLRIVSVASMARRYKGQDTLIQAVARCAGRGFDVRLDLVGDGRRRGQLTRLSEALGVAEQVRFSGQLPAGPAVRERLDQADLFVMPSLHEGLPRGMVEAMARALPCLGSAAGGIVELLEPEDTVVPGDSRVLAAKIQEVGSSRRRLTGMSARNLKRSREFERGVLLERRMDFCRELRAITGRWVGRRGDRTSTAGHAGVRE